MNLFAAECVISWYSWLLNLFQKVSVHRTYQEFQRSWVKFEARLVLQTPVMPFVKVALARQAMSFQFSFPFIPRWTNCFGCNDAWTTAEAVRHWVKMPKRWSCQCVSLRECAIWYGYGPILLFLLWTCWLVQSTRLVGWSQKSCCSQQF